MAKNNKMTFRFFVGGRPIEELSEDEREEYAEKAAERMGRALTGYYTSHPEKIGEVKK